MKADLSSIEGRYDVLLCDPPWGHYGSQIKWGAAAKFYETMTDEEILAMRVRDLMHPTSVLFLWATCPRLDFAVKCLEEWGLHYRGVAFTWIKCKNDGTPIGAQGVRPSIVKPLVELVLAASPTPKGRPMPLASESVCQTVFAPRGRHSEKPVEVIERINSLYPAASKLELFGRGEAQPGWSIWGNQAND